LDENTTNKKEILYCFPFLYDQTLLEVFGHIERNTSKYRICNGNLPMNMAYLTYFLRHFNVFFGDIFRLLYRVHQFCSSSEFLSFIFLTFNPITTNAKSCSNLAEIFNVASFIYLKNIIFYALIFYLALLKSY
jgi:hypothetical protein